ncbi:MAG: ABC transporter ATP-binding protein [Coriobacteriales bacterium]|nr:ABC transporter ATP-binding protein [Coriobacteriales bacterium]
MPALQAEKQALQKEKPVIDIFNLHRIYQTKAGSIQALRGVSLQVHRGEYVAIMGPSGSGKSTLMNILGCLDKPTSGKYYFQGTEISGYSADDMADLRATRIGFVFQSFNLLPRTSLLRNVMLPLVYSACPLSQREKRARAALKSMGLPEQLYSHKSNEISGGQMQRVAIARALINNPALILADEPTGNLDTATGEMVLETFAQLKRAGRTIVLITHEPDVAAHADRILWIRDGLILEGGTNEA